MADTTKQQVSVEDLLNELAGNIQARQKQIDARTESIERNRSHVEIVRSESKEIQLPNGMDMDTAIQWLRLKQREEERIVAIHHIIPGFPLDVGHAFFKVLEGMFGWVGQRPTPGFFGSSPPVKVSVRTGPGDGDFVQIPWDRVVIPGLDEHEEYLSLGLGPTKDGVPSFKIGGEVKRKNEELIATIAEATQAYAMTHSLIQGKATRINLSWVRGKERFDPEAHAPDYLSLTGRRNLIFPRHIERVLRATIYDRIMDSAKNDFLGIDASTGVLLVGDYGTGKTELALDLAYTATQEAGWSFMVVDSVMDLPAAVRIASLLSSEQHGFVLFAEDVDQANKGQLTHAIQYALDGAEAKQLGRKLVVVLTTNHVDRIDPALLRPGRLDQVITLEPADAETAERFIHRFTVDANGSSLLPEGEDVSKAAEEMAEFTPAFLREVIRLAKSMAEADESGRFYVTGEALYDAAKAMKKQAEQIALNSHVDTLPTIEEIVARQVHHELDERLDDIHSSTYRA